MFVVIVDGETMCAAAYLRFHPERRSRVLAALGAWLDAHDEG